MYQVETALMSSGKKYLAMIRVFYNQVSEASVQKAMVEAAVQ